MTRDGHPHGPCMDLNDGVSRRDAVIGVSFLGVLMAALSATIVYRIVDSKPPRGPRKAPLVTVTPVEEPGDSGDEMEVARFDGEVETVAHDEPVAVNAEDVVGAGDGAASPTFIAPSGR